MGAESLLLGHVYLRGNRILRIHFLQLRVCRFCCFLFQLSLVQKVGDHCIQSVRVQLVLGGQQRTSLVKLTRQYHGC